MKHLGLFFFRQKPTETNKNQQSERSEPTQPLERSERAKRANASESRSVAPLESHILKILKCEIRTILKFLRKKVVNP